MARHRAGIASASVLTSSTVNGVILGASCRGIETRITGDEATRRSSTAAA
jgi:hypothetical protein